MNIYSLYLKTKTTEKPKGSSYANERTAALSQSFLFSYFIFMKLVQ